MKSLGTGYRADAVRKARIVAAAFEQRWRDIEAHGVQFVILAAPEHPKVAPTPTASPADKTLRQAFELFRSDPAKHRTRKTDLHSLNLIELAVGLWGESRTIRSIDREASCELLDVLVWLPSNAEKKFPKLSPLAAARLAKEKGLTGRLSPASVNGYMTKFRAVMNFCQNEGWIERNPAKGLQVIDRVRRRDKRLPFSAEQLRLIFDAPIYRGCVDDWAGYSTPGYAHPRRGRFWVPLIALFSGMRMNEICQLHVADIHRLDGVDCFFVTEGPSDADNGKRLKTAASERFIPVHPQLVEIGFLSFVEQRRVVFEELISNAIDSYLIRKDSEPTAPSLRVRVDVTFQKAALFGDQEVMTVRCADNGCGLGDPQLKAFLTKDTSYKDDLTIAGIGKCKGAGRIQFFHHFAGRKIDSTSHQEGDVIRRQMTFAEPQKQIEFDDFATVAGQEADIGTTIDLSAFKETVRPRSAPDAYLSTLFSAHVLKRQMLLAFLQRLVGLSAQLADFEITFSSKHWQQPEQEAVLKRSDLPTVTDTRTARVEERDPMTGVGTGTFQTFKLSHYRLDAASFNLPRNAIAFCAKFSPVRDVTARYLRTRTEQNNPVGGFHHIVLIESDFLDQHVNEQRDHFENIPDELQSGGLFPNEPLSYELIYAELDPVIEAMVVPADWRKEEVISDLAERYGVTEAMLTDTSTRVVYGEPAQKIVERVLKKYQEKVIDETAEIYRLKEEIVSSEPDSPEFRQKINKLSWKYTASLKNFDMANLSQLVVRRACVVEVLELACGKKLSAQAQVDGLRRKDEQIIHSIFFPMRADSVEVRDHDIWLLSEEYHYYDYIASDMPLASIVWGNDQTLFENDIDQAFEALLAKRAHDHRAKRPDIALFSREGSAIIVEFKAPGVSMDDHVGDLNQYAHLLAAKSGGRLRRFYCYLIGDTLDPLRLGATWTQFPTGKG